MNKPNSKLDYRADKYHAKAYESQKKHSKQKPEKQMTYKEWLNPTKPTSQLQNQGRVSKPVKLSAPYPASISQGMMINTTKLVLADEILPPDEYHIVQLKVRSALQQTWKQGSSPKEWMARAKVVYDNGFKAPCQQD